MNCSSALENAPIVTFFYTSVIVNDASGPEPVELVETKTHQISPRDYLPVLLLAALPRALVVLLILAVLFGGGAAFQVFSYRFGLELFLGYALLYILLLFGLVTYGVTSKRSRANLGKLRTCRFTKNMYYLSASDGGKGEGPWSHFVKVRRRREYTLLYYSRLILPIPDSAFEKPEDLERFFEILRANKLIK